MLCLKKKDKKRTRNIWIRHQSFGNEIYIGLIHTFIYRFFVSFELNKIELYLKYCFSSLRENRFKHKQGICNYSKL